jgi:hypothetical protein
VLIVIATFVLALVAGSGFLTVGVVALVGDGFGGDGGEYGLPLGIAGVAEVFGALALVRLPLRNLALTAVLAWALLGAFRFPLGLAETPFVAAVLLAMTGFASALTDIPLIALVQQRIPDRHLAKGTSASGRPASRAPSPSRPSSPPPPSSTPASGTPPCSPAPPSSGSPRSRRARASRTWRGEGISARSRPVAPCVSSSADHRGRTNPASILPISISAVPVVTTGSPAAKSRRSSSSSASTTPRPHDPVASSTGPKITICPESMNGCQ